MKTVQREIRSIMVSSSQRKDDVQSHTVQSEFQDVQNGTPTVITSGKDTAHWADACIGSEIRPTARAPNKTANLVIVVSSLSPFAGRRGRKMECGIDAEKEITKARYIMHSLDIHKVRDGPVWH